MEMVATADVESGVFIGKRNMRGVFWRTVEGGEMEQELAAKYRHWAQHRRVDYPFAGRVLNLIAKSYDADAQREDIEGHLAKRLNT